MESIEQASVSITKSLQDKYLELKYFLKEVNKDIEEVAKEFRTAAASGDVSENAAYTEAKDELTRLNTYKIYLLMEIEEIEAIGVNINYVPKTYIDLYSTVRVREEHTGNIYTWKIFPGNITDMKRGIISSEVSAYEKMKGKEEGDYFILEHRITGEEYKYTILEVY